MNVKKMKQIINSKIEVVYIDMDTHEVVDYYNYLYNKIMRY